MKIDYLDLLRMADHAEDVAGTNTAANQNEYGFWLRLNSALQTLNGAPEGNPQWAGALRVFAIHSETIADFATPPGNDTDQGYWRRAAKSYALLTGGIYAGDWAEKARDALLDWPGGPDPDSLLAEDGSFLLSEGSDRILLE